MLLNPNGASFGCVEANEKRKLTLSPVTANQRECGYTYLMPRAPLSALRFLGLLLVNVLVAVIGTAILDTGISRAIPSHTIVAVLWKEMALSIVCATLIGFGMWRTWRSEAAKWTWVIPLLWFVFGLFAFAGRGIFGPLPFSSASNAGAAEMRSFFAFTIPLIRAIAYSVGACISSFVYPRAVASAQ